MTAAVVFPWRPQPDRIDAFEFVRNWFAEHLPDAPQFVVDTPHRPFNLAACRNSGVAQAGAAEVVVVCDADVIPDPVAFEAALAAAGDGKIHMPFDRFLYLNEQYSRHVLAGGSQRPTGTGRANGGAYIATPEAWWAVGGQDERFRGWGGEDDAFVHAATTLRGLVRHPGVGMAFWHSDDHKRFDGFHWRQNRLLLDRYKAARGNPAATRALIQEAQMSTTYLILCAGEGSRWTRDTPKHLARVCGEALLHRIVRQVSELDPGQPIRIVVGDSGDARYRVRGARLAQADLNPELGEIDKVVSSRRTWSKSGRTVVLLGDVFYTDEAIRLIVEHRSGTWAMFGRPGPSTVTGKAYNENFALVYWPEHHDHVVDAAEKLAELHRSGRAPKASHSQWFQVMLGQDPDTWTAPESEHYITVDDWTDDFDSVDDWDSWCYRWATADPSLRPPHRGQDG